MPTRSEPAATFTCNICGHANPAELLNVGSEASSCQHCRASIRFRAVALSLSLALYGIPLPVPQFPVLKSIRGIGIGDSDIYASALEQRFSYTNTHYHREPKLNLLDPDPREYERYDFAICSDVLEHVAPPISKAFETLSRLLKPTGVLILTVPYQAAGNTEEHFPDMREYGLTSISGKPVLIKRRTDGSYEASDQIAFHGGAGQTLEMRVWSAEDLQKHLETAGLVNIRFVVEGCEGFGVPSHGSGSIPIIASRSSFTMPQDAITELMEQYAKHQSILHEVASSRWLRTGRRLGLGPQLEKYAK